MVNLLPALGLGFVVGLRHALEADHVAAVGAIVARERNVRGAALIGAAWGLGHAAALLVLGGAIVAAGLAVPKRVALMLELGVGVMLLALGVWNFFSREKAAHQTHRHDLEEAEAVQKNVYTSSTRRDAGSLTSAKEYTPAASTDEYASPTSTRAQSPAPVKSALRRLLRPVLVGGMHGLAGSAAAALLVVAVAQTALTAFAYLACFGAGTTLGMVLVTGAVAVPMGRALHRFRMAETWVRLGAGALSFVVGAVVVYQIGFRDGLFFQ